ncbi:MAG: glycosyltransferase [Acidobacteriota bacterium]
MSLFISVIVPVHNGGRFLNHCLAALIASSYQSYEIIVVDDASTEGRIELSKRKEVRVFHLAHQSGPAAARNFGVKQAHGEVLFFVDADVVVKSDTLARVAKVFLNNSDISAVFGSYDDDPAEKNFISQYKNLYHHFVHQQSNSDAQTFWAGCGAIRREVFSEVGGFDQARYTKPAIEDIELGYRMREMGYQILLDKQLQVKHLKHWRLGSLVRADIFYRAVPWSKLMLENRVIINDLNVQIKDRVSAGLAGLLVVILAASPFKPQLLFGAPPLVALIIALNRKLYSFFLNRRGLKFAVLVFPLQVLYYLYSGVTFVLCWCRHCISTRFRPAQLVGKSPDFRGDA